MATVYVRNLNEKIPLEKLKHELKEYFEKSGPVLAVHAKKSLKMRGQAFVDFEAIADAEQAIQESNGKELFGKAIQTAMARTPSDNLYQKEHGRPREKSVEPSNKRAKVTEPPHNILFLQGLPATITLDALNESYSAKRGFVEARVFAAKNVGFIEFDTVENASNALNDKIEYDGHAAVVTFAKKAA